MKIKKEVGYYQVKELLDLKIQDGKEYCLVWWCNFPKTQATWEPIDNIRMISDWDLCYKQLKDKTNPKKQENKRNAPSSEGKPKNIKQIKAKTNFEKNDIQTQSKIIQRRRRADKNVQIVQQLNQKSDAGLHQELQQPSQPSIGSDQISQQMHEQQQRSESSSYSVEHSKIMPQYKKNTKLRRHTKKIEKNVRVVRYKGKKMELVPLSIDLQVTQLKNVPFEGLQLERIKTSFMKEGKILYEVQFKDDPIKEGIIMNEKYLKLLWPRKLAEYLLAKIPQNNGQG